jgi:trigger factor
VRFEMNVTVENAGPCRKNLRIEIPAQKVSEEYGAVVDAYTKAAWIPGFRQGKAPGDLVKKHYAKEIEQKVKDRLIPTSYQEALKEQKLDPVAVLNVSDAKLTLGQSLTFSVALDVPPEFMLPEYIGISVRRKKVEVKDEQVADTIQHILDQHARWDDVTGRPVQKGDLVQIDYEGICDNKMIEELAPKSAGLGKGKDFWMMVDENAFLPGFADGLLGANIGEKRQILVDFNMEFSEKAVAGKPCTYFVDIKGIREKKQLAMDEELLKSLGVESEEKLKTRIREDLQKFGEEQESRRLKSEMIKYLLEKTKLDVPESVVQQETRDTVYDLVREQSHRGVNREEIEARKGEIFEEASRSASEKVKMNYILHRIAEQEKIEATEEEVSGRIAEMALRYKAKPAELRAVLEKRNAIDRIGEDIRVMKTLDLLLAKANVKD